jgi:predicted XRE-type DNA-binding protein
MSYTVKAGENLFLAIGFPPHEAEVMQFRADLFGELYLWLTASGLSHKEAAEKLGVSEAKIFDMEKRRLKKFNLDTLVSMAGKAGIRIKMELDKAA